jgi:hypothetical protein
MSSNEIAFWIALLIIGVIVKEIVKDFKKE